jgi:thymidine kinase
MVSTTGKNGKELICRERLGRVEVITGGMFSGKTTELISRLIRAKIAKQQIIAFKANLDNRYKKDDITSHTGMSVTSIPVSITAEGVKQMKEIVSEQEKLHGFVDVIGIDEVHFFDDSIVDLADEFASKGKRVILAGLDLDFSDEPFEPMKRLLAKAEYVDKLRAVCVACGAEGTKTHLKAKTVGDSKSPLIGGAELYEARCRNCFSLPEESSKK